MSLLLDTHALLWYLINDRKLSAAARTTIDTEAEIRVSLVTLWELAIKSSTGKLVLPLPISQLFPEMMTRYRFQLLAIDMSHVERVAVLPYHHRDPFDRMLAAQSLVEGLTLVSRDSAFDPYGVTRLW